ncbi:hypothetical protein Tco_0626615 [Tanacetum coccineum]|uniref:Reverse transcriptase domain-containing protein n=1 Tax=Tanacetum coccineum TaxID=301880 RepID=A0ABQ4WK93_9ASTR
MTRMRERISVLERSNMRLMGALAEERERADSVWRRMGYIQDELRQIHSSRYYDRMDFKRLETFAMRRLGYLTVSRIKSHHVLCLVYRTMTITRSGMTLEAIKEMITRRVTEALVKQESNRNLGPIVESESENGDDNENRNDGGPRNGNGGRGNGGRNGNNGNNNNGNGDQGGNAVELELLPMSNGALTWWNAHKRTIGTEAAYALTWTELMNPKMVPGEVDRVERYIWGLSYNIQGNVTSSAPARLQDAVRMANSLMDQKVHSNAARQFDNKKK